MEKTQTTETKPSMIIKYWGVQGSIPAPLVKPDKRKSNHALIRKIMEQGGTEELFNNKYVEKAVDEYLDSLPFEIEGTKGGNSTCIEVQCRDSPLFGFDMGTGARDFGKAVLPRQCGLKNINPLNTNPEFNKVMHLFESHYHWDHIQGIPFFQPFFINGENRLDVHFYGRLDVRTKISEVLKRQQNHPNFPYEWEQMACVVSDDQYHPIKRSEIAPLKLGKAVIQMRELNHPDGVLAYAIECDGKKFVDATDTEHYSIIDSRLVSIAQDADIMYYDAQYSPEDYAGIKGSVTGMFPKIGWGHSTYEWGIKTALAANVKMLVLGHHEPSRDDFLLAQLYEQALEYCHKQLKQPENEGKKLEVVLAYDGLEHRL